MEYGELAEDFGLEPPSSSPSCDSPIEKIDFSEDSENVSDSDRSKTSDEIIEEDDEDEDYQSFVSNRTKLKFTRFKSRPFILTLN